MRKSAFSEPCPFELLIAGGGFDHFEDLLLGSKARVQGSLRFPILRRVCGLSWGRSEYDQAGETSWCPVFGFFNTLKSVYAELSPLALLLAAHIRISRRNRDSPKYALKQYSPAANRDQL